MDELARRDRAMQIAGEQLKDYVKNEKENERYSINEIERMRGGNIQNKIINKFHNNSKKGLFIGGFTKEQNHEYKKLNKQLWKKENKHAEHRYTDYQWFSKLIWPWMKKIYMWKVPYPNDNCGQRINCVKAITKLTSYYYQDWVAAGKPKEFINMFDWANENMGRQFWSTAVFWKLEDAREFLHRPNATIYNAVALFRNQILNELKNDYKALVLSDPPKIDLFELADSEITDYRNKEAEEGEEDEYLELEGELEPEEPMRRPRGKHTLFEEEEEEEEEEEPIRHRGHRNIIEDEGPEPEPEPEQRRYGEKQRARRKAYRKKQKERRRNPPPSSPGSSVEFMFQQAERDLLARKRLEDQQKRLLRLNRQLQ